MNFLDTKWLRIPQFTAKKSAPTITNNFDPEANPHRLNSTEKQKAEYFLFCSPTLLALPHIPSTSISRPYPLWSWPKCQLAHFLSVNPFPSLPIYSWTSLPWPCLIFFFKKILALLPLRYRPSLSHPAIHLQSTPIPSAVLCQEDRMPFCYFYSS